MEKWWENKCRLCILIINYGDSKDIKECIKSILDSDLNHLSFIVIVDNNAVNSDLENILNFYPYVKILNPERNLGFAKGNNFGFTWISKNIDFDYLLLLNSDTLLKNDTLSILLENADYLPEYKVFTPLIITDSSVPRIWYAGGNINWIKVTPVINRIGTIFSDYFIKSGPTCFASGCAILFRKNYFYNREKIFDPFFFMYDEDFDLCIELLENNDVIWFVSNAIVIHKCQGSQNTGGVSKPINQLSPGNPNLNFYLENTIPNRYYIVLKHFRGIKKLLINLSLTFYWLLKTVQYFINLNFSGGFTVIKAIMVSVFRGVNR